jgi:phage terminase large subunit-like protein
VSTFVVPPLDKEVWPTLGPQVCDFIEDCLVFGPGDLRGEPATIDPETRGLIYRMYEVYPQDHPQAGRRRFKRVAISQRKGTAKTEKSAWISAAELHPEGPVRCDGFDANGEPVGVAVRDPYIPMVAVTEEQTEELAYAALMAILAEGPLVDDFDIGLERITRLDGTGRAVALASAPGARDGARTTFEPFDETHRWVLARLIDAHTTMLGNLPKRKLADAWSLETTTAFVPGEDSVAEGTWEYAEQVAKGELDDPRLFFFHRQASDDHDLDTDEGVRAAVLEASGPAADWSDTDSIISLLQDPKVDRAYWERVWLNRPTQDARQAFSTARWGELKAPRCFSGRPKIVIGVDGARFRDAFAAVATVIETGFQFPVGIWERPKNAEPNYEHPVGAIEAEMRKVFEDFDVWKIYIDPQWIDHFVTNWIERWGDERVTKWETHRTRQVANAIARFVSALKSGDLTHDGDEKLAEHIGNARKHPLKNFEDDEGQPLWLIEKERPDSPKKMDGAMAAVLSWEARTDALRHGAADDPVPLIAIR